MIPDKLLGFYCYNEGNQMIGVADVTLPDITFMTDTIKGAGIPGEIDSPAMGLTPSMTTVINWRVLQDDNIGFAAPKTRLFDFRGSVQFYDELLAEYITKEVRAVIKCIPKKFTTGKYENGSVMGTSGEFEVTYYKITIEGKVHAEIDKFAYKYVVDGVDYLKKVRKDMGLS